MRLEDIKKAWNEQADKYNQWHDLDADERVEFALAHITQVTRQSLDDLEVAVYRPQDSAMSVAHALGHVQHYLTTPSDYVHGSGPQGECMTTPTTDPVVMLYPEERLDGTPCGLTKCPYYDCTYSQSCSASSRDDMPCLPICIPYLPQNGKDEVPK
jgi:hypothetical protein